MSHDRKPGRARVLGSAAPPPAPPQPRDRDRGTPASGDRGAAPPPRSTMRWMMGAMLLGAAVGGAGTVAIGLAR